MRRSLNETRGSFGELGLGSDILPVITGGVCPKGAGQRLKLAYRQKKL
jgi:hypothetical protein